MAIHIHPVKIRAADMNSKRNMIVHGLWGRMPKEYKTWKVFCHRGTEDMLLLRRDVMTVDSIAKIAAHINQLNRDLKKWMAQHGVPPP